MERDLIAELYRVAEDYEADILSSLRERAGHLWHCDGTPAVPCSWGNSIEDTRCEKCDASNLGARYSNKKD